MLRYVVRRIVTAIPTLVATSIAVFLLVRLMPGDVIDYVTGGAQTLTPEQRHQMEHQLGLDQSLPAQYWHWVSGLLTGDMRRSLVSTIPVSYTLRHAIPITAEVLAVGLLIAVVVAIPLGVISAARRDSVSDYSSCVTALTWISIPNYWLATLFLIFT